MKNLIIFIGFLFFYTTGSCQVRMAPIPSLPDTAWFDFWIGDWNLHWYEKDSVKATGKNNISRVLGNKIILEQFKALTGQNKGFEGKSWSVLDKSSGQWKQTWVDNSGAYLDFTGRVEGQNRIFERSVTKKDGTIIWQRMVFKNITPRSFTWEWESSNDNGKTWNLAWRIFYSRKKVK